MGDESKGQRGERHHDAKLTEAEVRAILAAYAAAHKKKGMLVYLGNRYGVKPPCIWKIVHRRNWRCLDD